MKPHNALLCLTACAALLAGCIPLQRPEHAQQSPITEIETRGTGPDIVYVGAPIAPVQGGTPLHSTSHKGMPVKVLSVRDGTPKERLAAYLYDDLGQTGGVLRRFVKPPTVRIGAGASAEDIDATVRAVQIINSALPNDWQLSVSSVPERTGVHQAKSGEILVVFAAFNDWPRAWRSGCEDAIGCARAVPSTRQRGGVDRGEVFIDRRWQGDPAVVATVAHEILHAMGRPHADYAVFPESAMVPRADPHRNTWLLETIDRDILFAMHGMADAGDTGEALYKKLGAWQSESLHGFGETRFRDDRSGLLAALGRPQMRSMSFGVATRNGDVTPWAMGPAALFPLEVNPVLAGIARWNGRLLGVTTDASVAGDARLAVDLHTLDGEMLFDGLEAWRGSPRGGLAAVAAALPGPVGSGVRWGDGDLHYLIKVRGNSFIQLDSSPDDGVLTGAFFGQGHEAMGGTLRRDDLTAAFGGIR